MLLNQLTQKTLLFFYNNMCTKLPFCLNSSFISIILVECIAVRDPKSSQQNASVRSLLLAGNFFCTTNSSRVFARERWQGRLSRIHRKKTQHLMNTLYVFQTSICKDVVQFVFSSASMIDHSFVQGVH